MSMKKFKALILLPLLTLVSCSKKTDLSILVPTGAPAVCFYNHYDNIYFETNSDAKLILSQMITNHADIAVVPTNLAVQNIAKKGLQYKIASIITFGNIFVASTGNDANGIMEASDYIVSFQQGSVPDLLFKDVYPFGDAIHYVGNAQEAAACLKTKVDITNSNLPVDYVVLAEPALTKLSQKHVDFSIYANLQEKYYQKHNQQIYQACVCVKNTLDQKIIKEFMSSLENDINKLLTNPDLLSAKKSAQLETMLNIDFDATVACLKNSNTIGIGYKKAIEVKTGIDEFLKLFGMETTNEEIYVQ